MDIDGKKVFITGGSGFLGRALTHRLLEKDCEVTIFSRSERPQVKMKRIFPECNYILGDIKDGNAIYNAMNGHEIVIHAAALKHVPIAEDQPIEAMKNNIIGSINVLESAKYIDTVKYVCGISTDKAAKPTSVYGMSKLLMEKMFYEVANNHVDTTFSLVRYGNVLFSSGSVIEVWIKLAKNGENLKITVPEMTRFFFLVDKAVDAVFESIELADDYKERGHPCINLVPQIKSCVLKDLLEVIMAKFDYDYDRVEVVGNRGNENIHEILATKDEVKHAEKVYNMEQEQDYYILNILDHDAPNVSAYGSEDCEHYTQEELTEILEDSGIYESVE